MKALPYCLFNLRLLKSEIYQAAYIKRSKFARCTNLHNFGFQAIKITRSLKSPRLRKSMSARCFLYIFQLPNILLEEIKRSFQWPGLELSNIDKKERVLLGTKHRAELKLSRHLQNFTLSDHFSDFSLAFFSLIESEISKWANRQVATEEPN